MLNFLWHPWENVVGRVQGGGVTCWNNNEHLATHQWQCKFHSQTFFGCTTFAMSLQGSTVSRVSNKWLVDAENVLTLAVHIFSYSDATTADVDGNKPSPEPAIIGASLSEPHTYHTAVQNSPKIYIYYGSYVYVYGYAHVLGMHLCYAMHLCMGMHLLIIIIIIMWCLHLYWNFPPHE